MGKENKIDRGESNFDSLYEMNGIDNIMFRMFSVILLIAYDDESVSVFFFSTNPFHSSMVAFFVEIKKIIINLRQENLFTTFIVHIMVNLPRFFLSSNPSHSFMFRMFCIT